MSDAPGPLPHADLSIIELMRPRPTDDPSVFVGESHPWGMMGVYGGHFLGQALAAGFATVDEPKLAHSFHAYFLRAGDPDVPIEYRVGTLRNGRGSDARTISAWQHDVEVFHMIASFKLAEDGHEHQPSAPAVPPADELVRAREARGEEDFPFPPTQNNWAKMEWVSASHRDFDPDHEPALRLWMRSPGGELLNERERQVVLAFLSDGPLMFNSIVPYGVAMETHWATSLDQSVWFHRPADPSQWMLFDQRSTAAADGRGMNEGEIYTADGALIMTCAQESMLRQIP
ncbi:MAG: thioesterase family protein, partial [Actinomycetota bacterium]|nr:thioesterase family protein [Actinomycetota bacterium]